MKARLVILLQYGCLSVGALLVSMVALARLEGEVGRQSAIESLQSAPSLPDRTLWSAERIEGYQASLAAVPEAPVAQEVPVYATASELDLNRGAGLIEGMGLPDKGGNLGIAGHRDGFFRVLKDIQPGQRIEVETRARTHRFRVVSTAVVDPVDVRVLADTQDPTVTLVTCYPFYFLGSAPQRFIVRGAYEWT